MRAQGIPHLFVTNTTSKSRAALADKLLSFGIPTQQAEILTPAAAAAEWLHARQASGIALFVPPLARLDLAGLQCLPDDAEQGASYVVVGDLANLWDYRTLNRAFRLLYQNPEAQLIALGMTRYWLAPDGIALDVAPFVVALQHASGRKALVFGKPEKPFFQAAVEKLGLPAEQVVMIGDDIEADIGGAQTAGLKGLWSGPASSVLQTLKPRSSRTSYLLPLLICPAGGMGKQCESDRDISAVPFGLKAYMPW